MARKLGRKIGVVALVLVVAGAAYGLWPRRVNLRDFDPAVLGRRETSMWRNYYEKKYLALFGDLYAVNRCEYGFSPCDSVRIAYYAAKAAKTFQPTRSRDEAQAALPVLEKYYGVMRSRSGENFEPRKAASLELDWWQLRRENTPPLQWGNIVAQTTTVVFHASNPDVDQSGQLRAEMMAYCDERRKAGITSADWAHIEEGLTRAYTSLKSGIKK